MFCDDDRIGWDEGSEMLLIFNAFSVVVVKRAFLPSFIADIFLLNSSSFS